MFWTVYSARCTEWLISTCPLFYLIKKKKKCKLKYVLQGACRVAPRWVVGEKKRSWQLLKIQQQNPWACTFKCVSQSVRLDDEHGDTGWDGSLPETVTVLPAQVELNNSMLWQSQAYTGIPPRSSRCQDLWWKCAGKRRMVVNSGMSPLVKPMLMLCEKLDFWALRNGGTITVTMIFQKMTNWIRTSRFTPVWGDCKHASEVYYSMKESFWYHGWKWCSTAEGWAHHRVQ